MFCYVETGSSGTFTAQQSSTAPTGFVNSVIFTTATADSSISASEGYTVQHRIEGYNVADLGFGTANAKTVTLSFWVRSSLTGTFSGSLTNGSFNRSYIFDYTISSANTWTQISVTIAGDTSGTWNTTNGSGLIVYWNIGAGSNFVKTANAWGGLGWASSGSTNLIATNGATLYITGVQLEAGTTASPFEYRQYTTELQLCERYCQRILGRDVGNTSSDWMGSGWNFTTTSTFTIVPLRTMLRSATGQSLYLSAAVGNYSVLNSSGTPIATSSMSIDTPSTRCLVITANVASGLTSGYPGSIYTGNSSSYYALITAEL
jgi:hypothetical protein